MKRFISLIFVLVISIFSFAERFTGIKDINFDKSEFDIKNILSELGYVYEENAKLYMNKNSDPTFISYSVDENNDIEQLNFGFIRESSKTKDLIHIYNINL